MDERVWTIPLYVHNEFVAFTRVDEVDLLELWRWKWRLVRSSAKKKPYAARTIQGQPRSLKMHRHLLRPPDEMMTDHINGDTLDNRRSNLRVCTVSQNNFNRAASRLSSTGIKGVYPHASGIGWWASISINGKITYLGYSLIYEEVVAMRKAAEVQYHGEFAWKTETPGSCEPGARTAAPG